MMICAHVWLSTIIAGLSVLCLVRGRMDHGSEVHPMNAAQSEIVRILEYVLQNDREWTFVLNQKIKLIDGNRPEYHDGSAIDEVTRGKLRLVDDTAIEVSPLVVLVKVANEFMWLNSYLQYAAKTLKTAFMCITTEYLSLQMELIIILNKKFVDNNVSKESEEYKLMIGNVTKITSSLLRVFIDKLAVLHSRIDFMIDLVYLHAQFSENETEDYYFHSLILIQKEFEKVIDSSCVRTEPDHIYKRYGVFAIHDHLKSKESSATDIHSAFVGVTRGMLNTYERLNIKSMSMKNWKEIFDFDTPIARNINLYFNIQGLLNKDKFGSMMLQKEWNYITSHFGKFLNSHV